LHAWRFLVLGCGGLRARSGVSTLPSVPTLLFSGTDGSIDETGEQGMAVTRRGGEFRMELAGQVPGVRRHFDNLHEVAVQRLAGDLQARRFKAFHVVVVDFVAVAVALGDDVLAVAVPHQRTGLEAALLATEAHGAAEVGILAALLGFTAGIGP